MDSIFDNADTLGNSGNIRLFTFWWDGIGYGGPDWFGDLQTAHATFNQAFAQSFPRLLYTNPFTSYNGRGIGIGSRLTGTGETTYSDAQLRTWIRVAAESVGIGGDANDISISSKTIDELISGQNLTIPDTTVDWYATTDGVNAAIGGATDKLKDLADASWMYWAMGGLILAIVLTRR